MKLKINKRQVAHAAIFLMVAGSLFAWGIHLFSREPSVKIDLQATIKAIQFTIDSLHPVDRSAGLGLTSAGCQPFRCDGMPENKDVLNPHQYPLFWWGMPGDRLLMDQLQLPAAAKCGLKMPNPGHLQLDVSASPRYGTDQNITFQLTIAGGRFYDYNAQAYLRTPARPIVLTYRIPLDTMSSFPADLCITTPWQWNTPLSVSSVGLIQLNEPVSTDIQSAIMSGTINLEDNRDPPVELHQGDILGMTFNGPATLLLSGDSAGIRIRLAGELTRLEKGLQKDHLRNLIPTRIHTENELSAILIALISIVLTAILNIVTNLIYHKLTRP